MGAPVVVVPREPTNRQAVQLGMLPAYPVLGTTGALFLHLVGLRRSLVSLSLFAEEKEKKCSRRDLTSPRLHSHQAQPPGPRCPTEYLGKPNWRSRSAAAIG